MDPNLEVQILDRLRAALKELPPAVAHQLVGVEGVKAAGALVKLGQSKPLVSSTTVDAMIEYSRESIRTSCLLIGLGMLRKALDADHAAAKPNPAEGRG